MSEDQILSLGMMSLIVIAMVYAYLNMIRPRPPLRARWQALALLAAAIYATGQIFVVLA